MKDKKVNTLKNIALDFNSLCLSNRSFCKFATLQKGVRVMSGLLKLDCWDRKRHVFIFRNSDKMPNAKCQIV